MNEVQIEQVEMTIEQARELVALRDALQKLSKNRDFKKIIDTGYFKDEAARVVLARANPGLQTESAQKMINNQITSIGVLRQYFVGITAMGNQAEMDILGHQETLEHLREEEDETGEEV